MMVAVLDAADRRDVRALRRSGPGRAEYGSQREEIVRRQLAAVALRGGDLLLGLGDRIDDHGFFWKGRR